jgi:uncharacterized protein (TIGR01777 family)
VNNTHQHILVAGGSGLIGKHLIQLLLQNQFRVSVLSRTKKSIRNVNVFTWDVEKEFIEPGAFQNVDAIINLAGQGIADKPWTSKRKTEVLESRTKSTHFLFKMLSTSPHQVKTFINASAIGIYKSGNEIQNESGNTGDDFLAQICTAWEKEAFQMQSINIRTVILRIGLVLSARGGMLKEILLPMKFFIAPVFGNGKQWQSWIHINDLCSMIMFAIENNSVKGVYNAVASQPLQQVNLTTAMQKAIKKPTLKIYVPVFFLKIFLGERANMLISSQRISNTKIKGMGFSFLFSNSINAIKNCIGKNI